MLTDESLVGCHVALTPTWSETAWFADYVLPMGVGAERHDLASYETHAGRWVGFRQPVFRVFAEQQGRPVKRTWEANPGEVWRRTSSGSTSHSALTPMATSGSATTSSRSTTRDSRSPSTSTTSTSSRTRCPACPSAPRRKASPRWRTCASTGAFAIPGDVYAIHEREVEPSSVASAVRGDDGVYRMPGTAGLHERLEDIVGHMPFIGDGSVGVDIDGTARFGFPTPSRKLELYSETLADWGWPEYAVPTWIRSHVHWEDLDLAGGERILLPTFRIPTLIHTRSGNAKWLNEISHRHPLWLHPSDAEALGIESNGLVRITTRTGWFVIRAWRTEGIRPGVVAASHHMGRWRLEEGSGMERWSSGLAALGHATGGDGRCASYAACNPSPATIATRRGCGGPTPACTRT